MEARELTSGDYDVVACDGFSGNVLIKSTEGTGIGLLKLLKTTFFKNFKNKMGALFLKKDIYAIKDFMELLDETTMPAKFGFTPKQIIDYKGLRGDDSDNLPGVPGVGDKTAVKLIQKYGDFETILSKADDIGGKLGENLKTYAEQARQCYRLATMR